MKRLLFVLFVLFPTVAYAETNQNWDEDGLWDDYQGGDYWFPTRQPPFNPGSGGSGGCSWFDEIACELGCGMISIADMLADDGEEVGGRPCREDCACGDDD